MVGKPDRDRYGDGMTGSVFGHEALRSLLRRASSHPASAYGFFGPEHVGKRGVAEEYARALLGLPAETPLSAHPDALILDARAEGGVDALKQFLERAHQTAAYGGRRVFFVDHADGLNASGMNALLKDVEEPRSGAVFLLIAGRPEALPATLRSRLVPLAFSLLSETELTNLANQVGAPARWAKDMLGRPGLLIRRQTDPGWWEKLVTHVGKLDAALRGDQLGLVIAALDEWQKAIEKTPTAEQDWRILLLLLMERWRSAPEPRVGGALVEAWRLLESSVPARLGMELAFAEERAFDKRGILASI